VADSPQDKGTAQERKSGEAPTSIPPVWVALIPVVGLIAALMVTLVVYKELELSTHIPMIIGAIFAALVALKLGHNWDNIEQSMVDGIKLASKACLILLIIGMLVGTWIQSGIVPAMVFYGLKLLTPSIFLVATCAICAVISLATGSSWSTSATVGVALIGVGEGLGLPRNRVAGAIISGAYFGDKMSPLSDTTNLAPAMAGANLFDHIRHMIYTTGPSLVISLLLYALLGSGNSGNVDTNQVDGIRAAIQGNYNINLLLLLPPLLVIVMVILRIPALPALLGGWLLGAVLAMTLQGQSLGAVLAVTYSGVKAKTGHAMVDKLLSRGGMSSMFSTVVLVLCAMSFGGVMEMSGMLESLAGGLLSMARGTGGLVLATVVTCILMNILASDQYLSVVVPGRMYRGAYKRQGLAPCNLSRVLEDSGTLTSVLIAHNTCGAFMISTLGLKKWTYVPYTFLNLINPLISIFYGFTGITMTPLETEAKAGAGAESDAQTDAEAPKRGADED
jgi:NhaC family Na+:H+ antiporter